MNQENIAVITGGASGIGLSATNRFLKEGYEKSRKKIRKRP